MLKHVPRDRCRRELRVGGRVQYVKSGDKFSHRNKQVITAKLRAMGIRSLMQLLQWEEIDLDIK